MRVSYLREWIVTNGLGGFASLSSHHSTTRKYHGLLIASLNPPVDRWVYVSNLFDAIGANNQFNPLDYSSKTFTFSSLPTLTYKNDAGIFQKTFFMVHQHNTTGIKYDIIPNKPITIHHYPLVTSRHFYSVHDKPGQFDIDIEPNDHFVKIKPNNVSFPLYISTFDMKYHQDKKWEYRSYDLDRMRNDASDDFVLNIGFFEMTITDPITYYIYLSLDSPINNPQQCYEHEVKRRKMLINQAHLSSQLDKLVLSSDSFIVQKKDKKTILAGYHWFSDWGRDTLIALPGLTLVTNRFSIAKEILSCLNESCHQGIIPNTYDDKSGEAAYNTVDASLWYIDRIYQYLKYTNDESFLHSVFPTLESIISYYKKGTLHHIHMDDDFLISHDPGLTWMDVKIGDYYPTPRSTKAVEIQALWYHALCIMSSFAQKLGKTDHYLSLAQQVKQSFLQQYQDQYDVIDTKDTSCRPNKIFLVSLDHTMIDTPMQKQIVTDIYENLLTFFGLRTLSKDHEQYKGVYIGPYNKDITYHNGMVWPWLLGPFITAFVKVHQYDKIKRKQAYDQFLYPMFHVFGDQWDGSIFEIFDGDSPYIPRGCINQAWSVAEILRAWIEDIKGNKPPFKEDYYLKQLLL